MFTKRIYPIQQTLNWTKKYIFVFFLIAITPYLLKKTWALELFYIPWLPIALIGTAVAFYLGFKNNASYERLWEARKIYGAIVNLSRAFAVYCNSYISNIFTNENTDEKELIKMRQELVKRHIAWMTALRFQLRNNKSWEHQNSTNVKYRKNFKIDEFENNLSTELLKYINENEIKYALSQTNPAIAILDKQLSQFNKLRENDLIDDFRHIEFGTIVKELIAEQGKAERIKNFPFPRQYASLNIYFVWLFIFLLPFGMLPEFEKLGTSFDWLFIPFCVIVSWVFHTMEMIGDYSENPFEGSVNDVPITTISKGIEKDIMEIVGLESPDISKHTRSSVHF